MAIRLMELQTDVTDKTDSNPLEDLRLADDRLKDDASTNCLEVSKQVWLWPQKAPGMCG